MTRIRRSTEVHIITGARRGVTDDVSSRTRRYLISMGIRTICVVLALFIGGWLRWVLIAGAVVLPYLSVVVANSGRERIETMPTVEGHGQRPELGTGAAPGPPGPVAPGAPDS